VIRRPFRRGLTLGLLGAAVTVVVRTVQSRRPQAETAAPASWDPIPDTTPVTVPPPPRAEPVVEVRTGEDAVEHFADASRQVERPVSDWEPTAPLPPAEETTPLTPPAVQEKPKAKADPAAVAALQEAPKAKAAKKAAAKKPAAAKATTKAVKKATKLSPWVAPVDGACPGTHPVKGKLSSKIFHVVGGFNYERTIPDRCYVDAAAAEADGLRLSKR
jgi:hypothetical protein